MRWLAIFLLLQATTLAPAAHKNTVTIDDLALSHAIWQEARGESLKGQKAVMDSILYRAKLRGLSVKDTLLQPHQYSWVYSGYVFKWDKEMLTRLYVLRKMNQVVKAEYFHSGKTPTWAYKMHRVAVIGKLNFYNNV